MSLNPVTEKKKAVVLSIPATTIHAERRVDFAVYYKSRSRQYKKLVVPGQLFPDSILRQLTEHAVEKLYIKGEDKLKYLLYLKRKENHDSESGEALQDKTAKALTAHAKTKKVPAKHKRQKNKIESKTKEKLPVLEAVPAKKFVEASVVTFPVFYKTKTGNVKKLLVRGNTFTAETAMLIGKYGLNELYIKKEDMEIYKQYLQDATPPFSLDPSLPLEEKAGLLYSHTTDILENLFKDPRCVWSFSRVKSLIEHMADIIIGDKGAIKAFTDVGTVEYNTHSHSFDVAAFAMGFGHHLGFDEKDIIRIGQVGMFHDIGKSQVDPAILNKVGPLDQDEFAVVKKHALYSNYILKSHVEQDKDILDGVKYHHERYDGSGYPDNLSGKEIPIFAQIVSIADVYDAVTSKKEYRDAHGSFETLMMMKNEMGHHFDKRLLMEFIKFMGPQYDK